jgi:hypothetical protein
MAAWSGELTPVSSTAVGTSGKGDGDTWLDRL